MFELNTTTDKLLMEFLEMKIVIEFGTNRNMQIVHIFLPSWWRYLKNNKYNCGISYNQQI